MYRLLGGHYSSVFAHTDSCANPSGSPLLQLLASFGESEQVATSPCCQRDLPDVISANPRETRFSAERIFEAADISLCSGLRVCSPRMPGPIPRRVSRSAHTCF